MKKQCTDVRHWFQQRAIFFVLFFLLRSIFSCCFHTTNNIWPSNALKFSISFRSLLWLHRHSFIKYYFGSIFSQCFRRCSQLILRVQWRREQHTRKKNDAHCLPCMRMNVCVNSFCFIRSTFRSFFFAQQHHESH